MSTVRAFGDVALDTRRIYAVRLVEVPRRDPDAFDGFAEARLYVDGPDYGSVRTHETVVGDDAVNGVIRFVELQQADRQRLARVPAQGKGRPAWLWAVDLARLYRATYDADPKSGSVAFLLGDPVRVVEVKVPAADLRPLFEFLKEDGGAAATPTERPA